jgi:hypothetical protein
LLPGCATLDGKIVGISSPYRQIGLLYSKFKEHFGRDSEDVLFIKAATRKLNPTIPQAVIDKAYIDDPVAAASEWGAEFRNDLAGWLNRETIEAAVDTDIFLRPPISANFYSGFCDPSGGVRDSFTLAVSHAEGDVGVVDAIVEVKAPFSPAEAVAQIAAVLKSYRLTSVCGDRYGSQFVVDAFAQHGITYVASTRDRSTIYLDSLSMFASGRVRLLDNARLVSQLAALERKSSPGGRDRVDHPRGHSDDVANSVCGALVIAVTVDRGPRFLFA